MSRDKKKQEDEKCDENNMEEAVVEAGVEEEVDEAVLSHGEEAEEQEAFPDFETAKLAWQKEKEELLEQLKRKQADLDNLRRIGRIEQAEAREYALHEFLSRILPVIDNLERALEAACSAGDVPESHVKGLEMIHRQLLQALEQEEVSIIEAVGSPFDPHCHHAVMQVEHELGEPGTVLEELQKGYRYRKRILRPAMVKVCKES